MTSASRAKGFGVAGADGRDAAITLRDWSLTRRPADGAWLARLPGNDFSFDLVFEPTQPVLLQGDQGLSRKGPDPGQASYYYSLPQMAARGRITLKGRALEVSARPGWTMNGARPCCTRTPSAGTGSG
jgi:predicted secreted hydrolase